MQKEIDKQVHLLKKVTRERDEARSEANESQQSAKNLFNEQKRVESQNDRMKEGDAGDKNPNFLMSA